MKKDEQVFAQQTCFKGSLAYWLDPQLMYISIITWVCASVNIVLGKSNIPKFSIAL